ncbi:MAG: response regulator transcription factor [Spartobacteria bacterium]
MTKLRILIADDHEIVRAGTRALLEQESDWEVCGTASDGTASVTLTEELKPDVVVLDLNMPQLSGLEAMRQIKRASPGTEVVIFTASFSEQVIRQLFEAGAKSYVRKSEPSGHLMAAVRSLGEHTPYFTPEIAEILFARFNTRGLGIKTERAESELTPRERETARLLAEGGSNKEIADALQISVRTVETHRAALMRKLALRSVADLVRYAIRNSIIEA